MKQHYDLIVVGAGLSGSIIAHEATLKHKSVLVLERRDHIGGNCYTKKIEDINVHIYGAHIFRTADKSIWDYMSQFCEFNNFINSPMANYCGEFYNMPFNMNTFHELWGVTTPKDARIAIENNRVKCNNPKNLEDHVLNMVGSDIYEKLVKGYTEKQWGHKCTELPPSIIRRIPLRFTYDNNYFTDPYQGIPKGGYTPIFEKLLEESDIEIGVDFLKDKEKWLTRANQVYFTGPVDEYYKYCFGPLEYRALRFEHKVIDSANVQGVAVINYTDSKTSYTRTIEHKHFEFGQQKKSVITREFPCNWHVGEEPYYPMEDEINRKKYVRYQRLASKEDKVTFGGRLGEYRYYDMQDTIKSALEKMKALKI